jgi:hypothetical protein
LPSSSINTRCLHPFIEAEKVAGHSVNHACGLLEVSRAAYYQRRNGEASMREVTDAELTEKITAVHSDSKGTYGSPRVHRKLPDAARSTEEALNHRNFAQAAVNTAMRLTRATAAQRPSQKLSLSVSPWPEG